MGTSELVGAAVLITLIPAGIVTGLKGRWTVILAGLLLVFPLWWYTAFAYAAPNSWWGRRFYRGDKLERAHAYQDRWASRFRE